MKFFETIQKELLLLGINPNESSPFNWKITMGFLLIGWSILTNVMYVFAMENPSLMDYLACFSVTTTIATVGICFIVIAFQQMKLIGIIEGQQKLVNKSNLRIFTMNLNFCLKK